MPTYGLFLSKCSINFYLPEQINFALFEKTSHNLFIFNLKCNNLAYFFSMIFVKFHINTR